MGQLLVAEQHDEDSSVSLDKRCILADLLESDQYKFNSLVFGGKGTPQKLALQAKSFKEVWKIREKRMFKLRDACCNVNSKDKDSKLSHEKLQLEQEVAKTPARDKSCKTNINDERSKDFRNQEEQAARMRFLHKLSSEGVLPKASRTSSCQTLIILDWDDTLFCTSYLQNLPMCSFNDLSPQMQCTLREIEKQAVTLMLSAIECGNTFIITNAETGWVETSSRCWMPSLASVLRNVQVISARSRYEAKYPDDAKRWKTETFLELGGRFDTEVVTNLISVGDSECEMEAARHMGTVFQRSTVKVVKFKHEPSPEDLLQQLRLVNMAFSKIVEKGRDLTIQLEKSS